MDIKFEQFKARDKTACLSLFDQNCPDYFAANEKADYEDFLDAKPDGYQLCSYGGKLVGAYGLFKKTGRESRIEWIMLSPDAQGLGIGSIIMTDAIRKAKNIKANLIHIATSHVAYKFFEKFAAVTVSETKHGWGPDMHKVDMVIRL